MAKNSCRSEWRHCYTLSIYRAEHSWQTPKCFAPAWRAGGWRAYGFVTSDTARRPETPAPIKEPLAL